MLSGQRVLRQDELLHIGQWREGRHSDSVVSMVVKSESNQETAWTVKVQIVQTLWSLFFFCLFFFSPSLVTRTVSSCSKSMIVWPELKSLGFISLQSALFWLRGLF